MAHTTPPTDMDTRLDSALVHLADGVTWKSLASVAGAIVLGALRADAIALFGIMVLVTLDFITGIARAKMDGREIISKVMGQTVWKGLSYVAFVLTCVVVANVMGERFAPLKYAPEWAMGFVAFTELKSITENVWGKRGGEIWGSLLALITRGQKPPMLPEAAAETAPPAEETEVRDAES